VGSILAMVTGSLPEWRREKWATRLDPSTNKYALSTNTYALARGNGHPHVFVIQDPWDPCGDPEHEKGTNLYLDDLAGRVQSANHLTRTISVVLATLWIILLITVGALSVDSWYLFGIGALGMVQNVFVAGFSRSPSAHGIPIKLVTEGRTLGRREKGMKKRPKVMDVLFKAEEMHPGLGLSLKDLFFPVGQMRADEIAKWDEYNKTLKDRKKNKKMEMLKSVKSQTEFRVLSKA